MPHFRFTLGLYWHPPFCLLETRSLISWRAALVPRLGKPSPSAQGHGRLSLSRRIRQTLPGPASPSRLGKIGGPGKGQCPMLHSYFDMQALHPDLDQASSTTATFMNSLPNHSSWPVSHSVLFCAQLLRLLTWGLTHFPVYNLASALIPNVLHRFSGNDLCFPFN